MRDLIVTTDSEDEPTDWDWGHLGRDGTVYDVTVLSAEPARQGEGGVYLA